MRLRAATVVHAVVTDGRSLNDVLMAAAPDDAPAIADDDPDAGLPATGLPETGLQDAEPWTAAPNDQRDAARDLALLWELSFGTLRLLPRLQALMAILLRRPLKPGERIIEALLLVGLYQLIATRIPTHAVVSATVAAAPALGRAWATGLLNATLRRFLREREGLLARVDADPAARWLFPPWLLERLQAAWPEHWQAICEASNGRAPMVLRVNRLRVDPVAYAAELAAGGIAASALPGQPQALLLSSALPVARLPGYREGWVSVQDSGAQWAATLLAPRPGERMLDACAAPGGKAAHLLEHADGQLALTAVDSDPARLATLAANLERLGLTATLRCADATLGEAGPDGTKAGTSADWPGSPYHGILLDVPCSATGVIRRHPDIKRLRRDADIPALVATQAALLDALWPLLAPGGRLLYATCSLLPEENEGQVDAFLRRQPAARVLPITAILADGSGAARPGQPRGPGWQLLPGDGGGDGFFYALLGKAG